MKTIEAKMSPRGLKHVASYFDNSLSSILRELLQNCRRAKATLINISCEEVPEGYLRIAITDNGKGISDPQDLLTLFETGWDDEVKAAEIPAGMGFFALSHLASGVRVFSEDWSTHIFTEVFTGGSKAEVHTQSSPIAGTRIEFTLDEDSEDFIKALEEECKYFPVPVRLNHVAIARYDYLEGADFIFTSGGNFRIGIFKDAYQNQWASRGINFFGAQVAWPPDTFCPGYGYFARIDVLDTSCLDLELPARKNVVQNEKLDKMRVAVRKAAYQAILHLGGDHSLDYASWKDAELLGIKLPEALPHLAYEHPRYLHEDMEWDEYGEDPGVCKNVTPDMLLSELENADLTALYINECECGDLLSANHRMEGYSWYPTQTATRLTQEIVLEDRKGFIGTEAGFIKWYGILGLKPTGPCGLSPTSEVRPLEINMHLEVKTRGKKATKVSKYPARIAFCPDISGYSGISGGWVTTDVSKVSTTVLEGLFFVVNDEMDGDVVEDDRHHFESACEVELELRAKGKLAAARLALQQAVDNAPFAKIMRQLNTDQITLELVGGEIEIKL